MNKENILYPERFISKTIMKGGIKKLYAVWNPFKQTTEHFTAEDLSKLNPKNRRRWNGKNK